MARLARRAAGFALRTLRTALLTAAAAAVFLGGVVRWMFPPEVLKEVLVEQLQLALRRPVQIESAEIVRLRGIRVRGLRVLEPPYLPGRVFLASGEFTATLRLTPLLRKRLVLGSVELQEPTIEFVRFENGATNLSDLIEPGGGFGPTALDLAIEDLSIRGGLLRVEDRLGGQVHLFRKLGLEARDLSLADPFEMRLAFEADHAREGRRASGAYELEARVKLARFDWERAWVRDGRFRAKVEGGAIEAEASVEPLVHPSVEAALSLPEIGGSGGLGAFFGVPKSVGIAPTRWTVSASFDEDGTVRVRSIEAGMASLSAKASGTVDLSGEAPRIDFTLHTNRFRAADLASTWSGFEPYALGGRIQWDVSGAGPWNDPVFRSYAVSVSGGKSRWKKYAFRDWDATLRIEDAGERVSFRAAKGMVSIGKHEFSGVETAASLAGDSLQVDDLRFVWNGYRGRARFRVENFSTPRKHLTLDASLERLEIRETVDLIKTAFVKRERPPRRRHSLWWLHGFKEKVLPTGMPSVEGQVWVDQLVDPNFTGQNLKLVWDLDGFEKGMARLQGDVLVEFGPGSITDIPALSRQHRSFHIMFLPFVFLDEYGKKGIFKMGSELRHMDYRRIHGEYLFDAGVMKIRNFYVDGRDLSATAEGDVDWARETLDTRVLIRENNPRGTLPQYFTCGDGKSCLSFFIRGPMVEPKLDLDLRKVPPGAIESVIERGRTIKF